MMSYGMALAAVAMIGHSLGANRPEDAVANCKLIAIATTTVCSLVAICIDLSDNLLISLYTDDAVVIKLAVDAFPIFVLALSFD